MSLHKKETINYDHVQHFEELLSPIYDKLYRYIYSIIRSKLSADDILQNTLLLAFTHLYELRDESKFNYWIFKIAKRESINFVNKYKKEISIDAIDYNLVYDEDSIIPEKIIINIETKEILMNVINSLNDNDRDLIILYYYTNLHLNAIANVLGVNENTVRTRHKRIKAKIYKKLSQEGFFENKSFNNDSEVLK